MLIAALSDLGMSMSRSAATELIDERVKFVARQARVTEPTARSYLTDDAIKGLAQKLAFSFVEETPGADLFSADRDARIPTRLAGRVSAGLAEAVRLRLVERDDLEHTRESVAQLAHGIGVLGLVVADQVAEDFEGEPWVRMPTALLHRLARYLDAAAGLADDGLVGYETDPAESQGLARALRDDARVLRTLADEG
jgi:hypothetical protein